MRLEELDTSCRPVTDIKVQKHFFLTSHWFKDFSPASEGTGDIFGCMEQCNTAMGDYQSQVKCREIYNEAQTRVRLEYQQCKQENIAVAAATEDAIIMG